MSDFGAQFRRLIDEESEKMAGRLSDQLGVDVQPDDTVLTVVQHAAYLPMSIEMLLDSGAITEDEARARGWTPTPPVKIPWRTRLRWRWQSWRERAGRRIGGWIAGGDLRDDDY